MAAAGTVNNNSWTVLNFPLGVTFPTPAFFEVDVAVTDIDHADDDVLLVKLPDDYWILNRAGSVGIGVESKLDAGGATIQFDLIICDVDGVADYTLISNCIIGRTDGECDFSDQIVTENLILDVGGKYIAINMDAVGDTAGTFQVYVEGFTKHPNTLTAANSSA